MVGGGEVCDWGGGLGGHVIGGSGGGGYVVLVGVDVWVGWVCGGGG